MNLIPVNEIRETDYRRAERQRIASFQGWLGERGVNATVRRTLGADISAACGQLRREEQAAQPGKYGKKEDLP